MSEELNNLDKRIKELKGQIAEGQGVMEDARKKMDELITRIVKLQGAVEELELQKSSLLAAEVSKAAK